MKTFVRDNGRTIALVAMFFFNPLTTTRLAAMGCVEYPVGGDFLAALFENW